MASELLLRGGDGGTAARWLLGERDEQVLAPVLRQLAPHATELEAATLVHERDGEPIAAWDREGALMLARALPPAYGELAETLVRHVERTPEEEP